MASWRRNWPASVRGRANAFVHQVRRRGRSAVFRAMRMTGATVAAYLVAQLAGLHDPPPLIAALTALLVVQATLSSTLVNGVQRVLSVVAGVALAVVFAASVGLTWWSLGALVAAAIVVGQLLRLGPHLVEVPISAMLVLGVGAVGAETIGGDRVLETLIGAAVGMLVNALFPPAVQTRYAVRSVERFAGEIAALFDEAAGTLVAGPVTPEQTTRWLQDARRLNRHVPRLDRALAHAEESRRLNVRALRSPWATAGVRAGLDALEYTSVSLRTLFRAMDDATRERTGVEEDADYADTVQRTTASLLQRMGTVVREFGRVLTAEPGETRRAGEAQLASALAALASGRALVADLLIGDPRSRTGLLGAELRTAHDRRPHARRARPGTVGGGIGPPRPGRRRSAGGAPAAPGPPPVLTQQGTAERPGGRCARSPARCPRTCRRGDVARRRRSGSPAQGLPRHGAGGVTPTT